MRGGDADGPDFLAVLFRKSPDELVRTTMAHSVDAPRGDGRGAVATAQAFDLPSERRAILRPLLEQTGLFGMGRAIRPLPLRPVRIARTKAVSREKRQPKDTSEEF